jgi:hypothetical protein
MEPKFVRILVAVLASFALFAFIYPDDPSENDCAYSQSKMLKESSVKISTHRAQQGLVVDSPTLLDSNKSARVPSSSVRMSSPILLPLGACILRC